MPRFSAQYSDYPLDFNGSYYGRAKYPQSTYRADGLRNTNVSKKTVDFSEMPPYMSRNRSNNERYSSENYSSGFRDYGDSLNYSNHIYSRNTSPTFSHGSTVQMINSVIEPSRNYNSYRRGESDFRKPDLDFSMRHNTEYSEQYHREKWNIQQNKKSGGSNSRYESDYDPSRRPMTSIPPNKNSFQTSSSLGLRQSPWKTNSLHSLHEVGKIESPTRDLPPTLREHSKQLDKYLPNTSEQLQKLSLNSSKPGRPSSERNSRPKNDLDIIERSMAGLKISAKIKLLKDTTLEIQEILRSSGPLPINLLQEKVSSQIQIIEMLD